MSDLRSKVEDLVERIAEAMMENPGYSAGAIAMDFCLDVPRAIRLRDLAIERIAAMVDEVYPPKEH